jgi:beta-lactamase class A
MKTPVLIEAFKQAAEGKFSLADSIWVHNSFKSIVDGSLYTLDPENDSEADLYKKTGQKLPLKELLYSMIIKSSNLATNTVIELVGAANVDKTMKEMGMKDMKVLRGVEDSKAYENGLNNTTNAYDLMLLFQKMALGETVSPEASKSMIDILLDQRFNEIIPARLPVEVKVAHKTGSITGVRHDSGIVFLPGGRKYILVLLSKGLEDEEAAVKTMANISELIFRNVNERR